MERLAEDDEFERLRQEKLSEIETMEQAKEDQKKKINKKHLWSQVCQTKLHHSSAIEHLFLSILVVLDGTRP